MAGSSIFRLIRFAPDSGDICVILQFPQSLIRGVTKLSVRCPGLYSISAIRVGCSQVTLRFPE